MLRRSAYTLPLSLGVSLGQWRSMALVQRVPSFPATAAAALAAAAATLAAAAAALAAAAPSSPDGLLGGQRDRG